MSYQHKLLQQTRLFRKLAIIANDEQHYWRLIQMANHQPLYYIADVINDNYNKPFFKLEDFLPRIWKLVDERNWLTDDIRRIKENFKYFTNEILRYVITKWIENRDFITVQEYLEMEDQNINLPADILRKAQFKIINRISKGLESENEEEMDGAATNLAELIDNTKQIPKNLLINLAKHYGEDVYVTVMNNATTMPSGATILDNESKLTKYDIAFLFSSYLRTVGADTLKNIIERADSRGKEYIRRFLFQDVKNRGSKSTALFMLAEDMTPMNINGRLVEWPSEIRIMTIDEIYRPLKDQWIKVYHDFKIIPLEY